MSLASLPLAAYGADFSWKAPEGKSYTISGTYAEVFHFIPNDELKVKFAAAKPEEQQRYPKFKDMQVNNPAAGSALQDRVNQLANDMNLGYRPQVDIDVLLERGMGASGNTDWNGGNIKVRISANIVEDGELLRSPLFMKASMFLR